MKQKHLKTTQYNNKYRMRLEWTIADKTLDENDIVLAKNYRKENNKLSYKYYVFSNEQDYLDHIEENKNTDLFENIQSDIPKIYFDIDLPDKYKAEGLFRHEVKFILGEIIRLFNLFFQTEITKRDLLVYARRESDEMVRSIHIIIPKYRCAKETVKKFVEVCRAIKYPVEDNITQETIERIKLSCPDITQACIERISMYNEDKKLITHTLPQLTNNLFLDNQVYGENNQNLCLPYQTKYEYDNQRILEPFNSTTRKNESVDKYCCNIVKDTEEIESGEIIQLLDDMVSKVVDDLQLDVEFEKINCSYQKNSTDKNAIKLNQYDLVDYLIANLPIEFYSKNSKWCSYTAYLKLYEIDNLDKWLKVSAEKSEGEYSLDDNKKWIESVKVEIQYKNINNFINKFIGGIITDYPNLKIWFEMKNTYDTVSLRAWISKVTKIPLNKINSLFNAKAPSSKSIYMNITGDWKLYISALDLLDVKTGVSTNYYFDDVYAEVSNSLSLTTNENIGEDLTKFMATDCLKQFFNINAKWGSGKTHLFIKSAIKIALSLGWRILLMSENNVLNRSIFKQLQELVKELKLDVKMVKNHLSLREDKRFEDTHRICITSTESIHKLTGRFHLIILDEYESVFNHYESLETHKHTTPYKSSKILEAKLRECRKIISLDADLSQDRLKIMYDALEIKTEPEIYYSNCNKWKDYTFNAFFKKYEIITKILDDVKCGKNIAVACMSKTTATVIAELINKKFPEATTLCIWSKVCKMNGADIEHSDAVKDDIENVIQKNKIQVWIYSPSVKTGLSINTEDYFHKTYLLTKQKKSCCAREAIQMIFRTRDLIDKHDAINILLPKLGHIKEQITDRRAELHLTTNLSLSNIQDEKPTDTSTNKFHFQESEFYKNIRVKNIIEWNQSNNNLGHEILRRLTKNHGIKVNIIHEKKITYGDLHEDIKDIKKDLKFNLIKTLINTELVTKSKYDANEEEKKSGVYTSQMINENKKRYLFNSIGICPYWTYYNEGKNGKVEKLKMWGYEYYGVSNTPQETPNGYGIYGEKKKLYYTNFVDGMDNGVIQNSHLYDILLSDKHSIINNINNSNKFCLTKNLVLKEEPAINQDNLPYVKWKADYTILDRFVPEIYLEGYYGGIGINGDIINLDGFEITSIEFNKRMRDEVEWIKENFSFYETVYKVEEGFDWKTFSPSNSNHKKAYYKYLQRVLGRYGYELITPQNKNRDSAVYRGVLKKHTIEKNHHIPFIHTNYYNKNPIETDKLLIDYDSILKPPLLSINSKTDKITTNKNKKQKAFFQEHAKVTNYPTSLQLYKREGNRWVNGKIVGKLTLLKSYEDPKKVIITKPIYLRDTDENTRATASKFFLSCVRNSYLQHFSKFRVNESTEEIKEIYKKKYNWIMREDVQKRGREQERERRKHLPTKCVIESDTEDEEDAEPYEPSNSDTNSDIEEEEKRQTYLDEYFN